MFSGYNGEPHRYTEQPLKRLREWENSTLLSAGFEPVGDNLWKREGILYGREAALQYARRFADERIGKSDNRQA